MKIKIKIRLFVIFFILLLVCNNGFSQTEEKSAGVDQNKVKQLLNQAQQAILKGDDIGAEKYLSEAVDLAYKAWDIGDVSTSESIFRQVLKLKSDYPKALFGLAELYRRINPPWAIEYYTRYLNVNPGDANAYFGRGTCYLMREAYSLAVQDLKYLVDRLQPNHVQGLTNLALALRGQAIDKNYDPDIFKQAVDYMQRAVEAARRQITSEEVRKLIPSLLYRFGRLQFEYQQVLAKANPEQADYSLAIDSLEQSIRSAKELLKEMPDNAEAVNQIILSLDALTEIYNAMIQTDTKNPRAYIELVRLTERKTRAVGMQLALTGLEYLRKAVQSGVNDAKIWFLLATKYGEFGMIKEAIESVDKAIALSPNVKRYKEYRSKLIASTQPTTHPAKK